MNSETLGLLLTANHQHRFHFVNPNFIAISGLIHITIQFVSQIKTPTPKTAPKTDTDWTMDLINSNTSIPRFGTDQTVVQGLNKPKHYKTLKQSVTSSRIKPLPHGVYRNSSNPVPTRSPRCVEPLSFLSRRIPTVGSPRNLEKSHTLSH